MRLTTKTGKESKFTARYRKATVKGRNCGTCAHMRKDGMCAVVSGPVERDHVSDLYKRESL